MQSLQLHDLSNNKARNSSSTKALIALPCDFNRRKDEVVISHILFRSSAFRICDKKENPDRCLGGSKDPSFASLRIL
jgi:hypothetical protein